MILQRHGIRSVVFIDDAKLLVRGPRCAGLVPAFRATEEYLQAINGKLQRTKTKVASTDAAAGAWLSDQTGLELVEITKFAGELCRTELWR